MPSIRKKPDLVSVTSINEDGTHYILHPADVRGRFTMARRLFAVLLIVVYAGLPWIPINGAPAVLLDVSTRQFHLFGLTLVPQDLWVLFFAITGLGFGLFFVTSLLGRVWCGWACPYTVFLEHVFRRVERWIDGDAPARRKLAGSRWTYQRIWRFVLKHGIYLLCASMIAHVFLSYFISVESLYAYLHESPLAHPKSFLLAAGLTAVLYFCFARFREQFCIIMCPYGRLQSALTDEDTMVIGYDEGRGEPRGSKRKSDGGCVDCQRCVQVCPTGIDIRNGLQLECIGCAACIDACDEIMDKVGSPRGLVRYDSQRGLGGEKKRVLRPRIFAYAALGSLGLLALLLVASQKAAPYNVSSARFAGKPFELTGEHVVNRYQLRLINKRNQAAMFSVKLHEPPAGYSLSGAGQEIAVAAHKEVTRPTILLAEYGEYEGPVELTLHIHAEPGDTTLVHRLRFVGPHPGTVRRKGE